MQNWFDNGEYWFCYTSAVAESEYQLSSSRQLQEAYLEIQRFPTKRWVIEARTGEATEAIRQRTSLN